MHRDAQVIQGHSAASLSELRGIEGMASKHYFAILRQALHPDFYFEKRTRRPPKDPANALLSLSYTLLTQAAFSACRIAGLDAYDGFYHADKYGRPALALGLVEEFRALVADSVVLTLVNNRRIQPDDFQPARDQDAGIYLTRKGWRTFLHAFSRKLQLPVYHLPAGKTLSYQKILEVQARGLRKCIESGIPDYQPFLAK